AISSSIGFTVHNDPVVGYNGSGFSANMDLRDNSAFTTGVGGGMVFSGQFRTPTSPTDYIPFAAIKGGKENATSANYAGSLGLYTVPNGGAMTERVRINSSGNVGIGSTSPNSLLSIGNTNGINFDTATSTFYATGGINLTAGCFAIGSNCLSLSTISGTLNLTSQVSGTLPVANGGTGWAAVQASALLYGNGSGALATTTAGTNGQVLAYLNGIPTWTASTTLGTITGTLGIANGGTATTTFYNGGVTFYNSTLGTLSQGTTQSDFFYDVANKKLGIGTSSPQALIHVNRHNDASIAFLASRSGSAPSAFGIDFNSGYTRVGSVADIRLFTGMTVDGSLSSATERLTILSASGNVGIGTASPSKKFQIQTTASAPAGTPYSNTQVLITGQSTLGLGFHGDDTAVQQIVFGSESDDTGALITYQQSAALLSIGTAVTNGELRFTSNTGSERARIDSAGDFGIGTTSPWGKLSVTNTGTGPSFVVEDSTSPDTTPFIIDASGNVGIGTTTPGSLLSIAGDSYTSGFINTSQITGGYKFSGLLVGYASTTNGATIWGLQAGGNDATTTATVRGTTAFGYKALSATTGATGNSAFGYQAGNALTTGAQNTAIGYQTLNLATTSPQNTAIGYGALAGTADGNTFSSIGQNTAIGYLALNDLTTGYRNVALGFGALDVSTTGLSQVAVGYNALGGNTTGSINTAIGAEALGANTIGNYNTAIGASALDSSTSGSNNVAIGYSASLNNKSATSTVVIGWRAGYGATTLYNQGTVAIGYQAGRLLDVGSDYNTMLGYQAGYNTTTGSKNIQIGSWVTSTNANITTGSNNIIIGNDIQAPSATASNQLNIQNIIFGTGNSGTAATLSTGLIGIGTTTPSTNLSVQGNGLFSGTLSASSITATSSISALFFNASQYGGFQQNSSLLGYASTTNTATIWGLGAGGQNATTSATSRGTVAVGYEAFNALTSGANNTAVGYRAGYKTNDQGQNSFFGYEAGAYATTSSQNVAIGYRALKGNTSTFSATLPNTAVGYNALTANTTGGYNTAIGNGALAANTTGSQSIAIGQSALTANTTGSNNAIGYFALSSCTTGCGSNNAFGNTTLQSLTTGQDNTAFGNSSQFRGTTAGSNASFGYASLYTNKTGTNNVAFGNDSLRYINNATSTIAIGSGAGADANQTGGTFQNNVFIGYRSGYLATTGADNNILIGYQAGNALTTGASNILLGYDIDAPSNTGSNQLSIGNLIFGTGIDGQGTTVSSGNIGIASSTPWGKLSVTNTGTGPSFVVEDSTSPDSTPFIIDASGNVGVGTASPAAKLHIGTATSGDQKLLQIGEPGYVDTYGLVLRGNDADGVFKWYGLNNSVETTNPILSMARVTGNVGIGSTTPSSPLVIKRDTAGDQDLLTLANNLISSDVRSGRIVMDGFYGNLAGIKFRALNSGAGANDGVLEFQTGTNSVLSTKMTILDSGNVGIGTTSPSQLLSVAGDAYLTGGLGLGITNTTDGSLRIQQGAGTAWGGANTPQLYVENSGSSAAFYAFGISTAAGNSFAVTNAGNVGIGATDPTAKLVVRGGSLASAGSGLSFSSNLATGRLTTGQVGSIHTYADNESVEISAGSSQPTGFAIDGQTSTLGSTIRAITGGSERLRITSAGNVGIGTTTPAGKLSIAGNSSSVPGIFYQLTGGAESLVWQTTGSNNAYGWKLIQDESVTGNQTLRRRVAGTDYDVMTWSRGDGNVGIGTTTPVDKLQVYSSSNSLQIPVRITNDNGGTGVAALGFGVYSSSLGDASAFKAGIGLVRNNSQGMGDLAFYNRNSADTSTFTTSDERMRITSAGNVGNSFP
ncbi:MAG: hypothetical protein Greene07147_884, partial [Parcubacteria group bacterium Greene0714_7]